MPPDLGDGARGRVGDYVRRALPRELARRGIGWPCAVKWDEREVRAFISRGKLTLDTFHRRVPWWQPTTQERGDAIVEDLANVLQKLQETYAAADSTGRIVLAWWRDGRGALSPDRQDAGRPVTMTLAPGVRLEEGLAQGIGRVAKHGEHVTVTLDEAERIGWVTIE